jgi:hypothetical protein
MTGELTFTDVVKWSVIIIVACWIFAIAVTAGAFGALAIGTIVMDVVHRVDWLGLAEVGIVVGAIVAMPVTVGVFVRPRGF